VDYEYRGLVAQAWDLFRGDTSDWADRHFWLELIHGEGEPVLDVGCGTGRLLLDYLGLGIDVEGVDVSPEMLALCREKGTELGLTPTLYLQSMEELDLPRRYRTILVPSSSFQLVLEPDAARSAMHRLAAHLAPGGALLLPFTRVAGDHEWAGERVRADGAVVRRRHVSRYDPETQLEDTDETYELIIDGEVVAQERHVRAPATRDYTLEQALALLDEAGLMAERVLEGFTQEPYAGGEVFTVLARNRPEATGASAAAEPAEAPAASASARAAQAGPAEAREAAEPARPGQPEAPAEAREVQAASAAEER
jgi:ubiquinone/menaquinone biosynthesis C-methylase UbiE